jgi:hypothetical protein
MAEQVKKFLSMLRVEIEDLEDSIRTLMTTTDERFQRHEITGYVWTENRALLQREINLLELVGRRIAALRAEDMHGIHEVRETVRSQLEEFGDMPEAIPSLIEKRMEKILRYLGES